MFILGFGRGLGLICFNFLLFLTSHLFVLLFALFGLGRLKLVFFLLFASSQFFGLVFRLSTEHFFVLTDFLGFALVFCGVSIWRNDGCAAVVKLERDALASFLIYDRRHALITGISRFIPLPMLSRSRRVNVSETCLASLRTVDLVDEVLFALDNALKFPFVVHGLWRCWFWGGSIHVLIFAASFIGGRVLLDWWSTLFDGRIGLLLELTRSSRSGMTTLLLFCGATSLSLVEIIWRHFD